MIEENHEITLKFSSSEELLTAYHVLQQRGYDVSCVSDYKMVALEENKEYQKRRDKYVKYRYVFRKNVEL